MSNESLNNTGNTQHPMLSSIYSSPLTASVISKLIEQPTNIASSGIRDAKSGAEASRGELQRASLDIQREMRDAENAMELFPDIELSKQTLISSIIAPNNMTQEDMNIGMDHPYIPADIGSDIIEVVKDEVMRYYKLEERIFEILENALFTKGSHVEAVLPESAVDHLINERPNLRVESVKDMRNIFDKIENTTMGFLGPLDGNGGLRFESYTGLSVDQKPMAGDQPLSSLITIGDNFGILKFPKHKANLSKAAVRSKVRSLQKHGEKMRLEALGLQQTSTYNTSKVRDVDLKNAIYKSAPSGSDLFLRVPDRDNLRRHSVGRPLNITIPSEAALPVHFPGDPTKHIGVFVLVDQDGYFLSKDSQRKFIMNGQNHLNMVTSNASGSANGASNNISSNLLEKARQNLKGSDTTIPLTYLAEIFGNFLEEDLLKRVKNGIHSTEAAISRNNDIYQVMLARSLAGAQTQIIYLPKEFFTYFAFKYNSNGTGRSLLSEVSNLISLRAVSMYAKIANQIRNAISITDVNIELDPRDPSPNRTIEKIVDLTSQTRTQFFPWGLNTPADIANWWHRAGFQMHVTGHPGISATKIEYSQRSHDKNVPNVDDDDQLNDMIHMHFGITPEMRDAGFGAQFATSIANNNILFSKRVIQYQLKANALLSDFIQVIANNDSFISNKLRGIIKEKWGVISSQFDDSLKGFAESDQDKAIDYMLDEVIDALFVQLPSPDMTSIKNQMEAFTEFKEALDACFEFILSDDAVSQATLGESAEKLVALREPLKAQIVRDWMRKNNFLPELFDLVETDEEGQPKSTVAVMANDYMKNLAINITSMLKSFVPVAVATAKDLNEITGTDPENPEEEVI